MRKSLVCLSALLMVLGTVGLAAQTTPSQGGSTDVEEEYLWQGAEIQQLSVQARDNSQDNKELAITGLRAIVEGGNGKGLGDERAAEVVSVLEGLAGEGVFIKTISNGEVINNFPTIRRDAVQLLGKVGGQGAKNILIKVAKDERDPMVLAEAVYALGKVTTKDDKDVLPYVVDVMLKNHARVQRDDNLAFACLLALEKLITTYKGAIDRDTLKVIMLAADKGNYNDTVYRKARQLLDKINPKKRK